METNENEICYIRFGKMIATMRSSQGKTQDAFADECGISKSELRKIEEGVAHITVDTLLVLARNLGPYVFLSLIGAFYKAPIKVIFGMQTEAICKEMMHALYMFLLDDFASLFAKEQQDDDHHCHDKEKAD